MNSNPFTGSLLKSLKLIGIKDGFDKAGSDLVLAVDLALGLVVVAII
jgi:hypothetical protein